MGPDTVRQLVLLVFYPYFSAMRRLFSDTILLMTCSIFRFPDVHRIREFNTNDGFAHVATLFSETKKHHVPIGIGPSSRREFLVPDCWAGPLLNS